MDDFKTRFPQAKTFEDFRHEISIIELAIANGYHHEVKKGLKSPVFYNPEKHDRIIILNPGNPANQGYWNPDDETDKGSLINFVKKRLGVLFPQDNAKSENANVNAVLYQYLKLDPFTREQNRRLVHPEALANVDAHKFLSDYYKLRPLHQKDFFINRGISLETLEKPEFSGRIFNVQFLDPAKPGPVYTNVAFPYHLAGDSRMVGLEIRNTNYKAHAEGTDRSHGVWHSNMPEKLERIVMVESALDALAFRELRSLPNTLYVSYGGNLTLNQIQTIKDLKALGNTDEGFRYVSASDNDIKGAWYDLMFIRELAAGKFPSQRLANPRTSIKLAFASGQARGKGAPAPGKLLKVLKLADKLIRELAPYNRLVDEELKKGGLSNLLRKELEREKIKLQVEGSQFIAEIPATFFALRQFNQALIVAAGLQKKMSIEKAVLNDFNEDLKLLKRINKDPVLLADIKTRDLQKSPAEKLAYQDLKDVMARPGRYEQFQQKFDLSPANEESRQLLEKESQPHQPNPQIDKPVLLTENQADINPNLRTSSSQAKPGV